MSNDAWIWKPAQEWIASTNVYRLMQRLEFHTLEEFLLFSRESPERFWHELATEMGIEWFEPYAKVLDDSEGAPWCRWFVNGKLNVAWNCLDRHALGAKANHLAVLFESEDGDVRSLTYAELYDRVNRLANGLKGLGLTKGDRVAMCMPMVPEVIVILYACLRLGLIVVPIFSGFGPGAIATRLEDSGARVVFTVEEITRRGKRLPLREKVEEASAKCRSIKRVVVWPDHALLSDPTEAPSLHLDSEDYALILYTSGTTGRPKGAVHTPISVALLSRQTRSS